jgi:hypothetical protein
MDWFKGIAGENFVMAAAWTLLALLVLVIVLVAIRIVRSMTFGTFVAGGRNRKTRLAVMDAAAVDSQRRLVLVRRDDVEHLILIGGPTDVVVERDIKLHASSRRPAAAPTAAAAPAEPAELPPRQRPPEAPALPPRAERPPQPPARPEPRAPQLALATHTPQPRAAPPPPPAPAASPPATPARPAAVRMPPAQNLATPRPAPTPAPSAPPPPPAPKLKPLETPAKDLGFSSSVKMRPKPEMTLEDEMNRLLGELSSKKSS